MRAYYILDDSTMARRITAFGPLAACHAARRLSVMPGFTGSAYAAYADLIVDGRAVGGFRVMTAFRAGRVEPAGPCVKL